MEFFFYFLENNIKAKLVVNAQSKFLDYFNNSDDNNENTNTFPLFIRTVSEDVDRMVTYTIFHFQAILEILFIFSILFILSKVSLNITLISFTTLFILITLTVLLTKNSLKNVAEKRQFYENKTTEIIRNIFISSVLIRLLNRQKYFKNILIRYFKNKYNFNNKKIFIVKSPKFIIEFLIIVCFLSLLFIF